MSHAKRRGFSLIEALASVALVSVGMVAVLRALADMNESDYRLRTQERMQRLATEKYDELLATGVLTNASQTGDFQDQNLSGYQWRAEVIPSTVTNLDLIQVTVSMSNNANGPSAEIDGLRYTPPTTTTATPATGTGGAAGTRG